VLFFNKNCQEQVRSIFHNRQNHSVIIVSVTAKDECNSLKCRSVPVSALTEAFTAKAKAISALDEIPNRDDILLKGGGVKGIKLFKDFCLRYPDFIEFDELNAKIITKHSVEDAYRVWSLQTYQLQYVLKDEKIAEFKICHGVMLLLYAIEENCVPMSLINVHTGKPIMKIHVSQTGREIEFLEQFNERIMIKTKGNPLKIFNSWDHTQKLVQNFAPPEAFIFLYEKEKFLTLKEGKIEIWTSDGTLLTDFGGRTLCTRVESNGAQAQIDGQIGQANYIVSVS
jgi:hypothetical protein